MIFWIKFPSSKDVLPTKRRSTQANHPGLPKKYNWFFLRVKNKLTFFKLADEVEILVQDFYSSLTIIQSKEDLWLAEGTVRRDYNKHASRFNPLAAEAMSTDQEATSTQGNEEVSHPQCRLLWVLKFTKFFYVFRRFLYAFWWFPFENQYF